MHEAFGRDRIQYFALVHDSAMFSCRYVRVDHLHIAAVQQKAWVFTGRMWSSWCSGTILALMSASCANLKRYGWFLFHWNRLPSLCLWKEDLDDAVSTHSRFSRFSRSTPKCSATCLRSWSQGLSPKDWKPIRLDRLRGFASVCGPSEGKHAETRYEVIDRYRWGDTSQMYTLLKVHIVIGHTHRYNADRCLLRSHGLVWVSGWMETALSAEISREFPIPV